MDPRVEYYPYDYLDGFTPDNSIEETTESDGSEDDAEEE